MTIDSSILGLDLDATDPGLAVGDLLDVNAHIADGQAYLAWQQLSLYGGMHTRLVAPTEGDDYRLHDAQLQLAQRIAMSRAVSVNSVLGQLDDAVAMRDRLPITGDCVRDGLISGHQFHKLVSWIDLIDGQPYAAEIDAEIAAMIRAGRRIPYSTDQLRLRVDRLIFRRDPDAVRQRRRVAVAQRCMFTHPGTDGMASIGATMTAENVRIAAAHVTALAKAVCCHDPRTLPARASDALYALLTQTEFGCQCEDPDSCTADLADVAVSSFPVRVDPKVVVHVVINESTLTGEDDLPGFVDGHGVISADHARDLAARPDAIVRPVNPDNPHGGAPRWAAQSADPYRPTTLLDTYLRIRDGHSVVPGSRTAAWDCDLDHVNEYSPTDPDAGGQTSPSNMNTKDRLFHNMKTHGDWLDDHDIDADGRAHPVFYTPEGDEIRGHPGLGIDLFPGLKTIHFNENQPTPNTVAAETRSDTAEPQRQRTRLEYKHQRRRAERNRNKQHRTTRNTADGDPPF